MWNFNKVMFLKQDNLIQLFSDEKKLTSPYQLEWNNRVKSLKIFIEDMKWLFDQKEIINNQLSHTFKNLVDLNIYVLKMDNVKYHNFSKLKELLKLDNSSICAIKYSNKKALFLFQSPSLYCFEFQNEIFGKSDISNLQFILNYSELLQDDCEESLKQFLQDKYPKNEFQQLLNKHENVTFLHAKILGSSGDARFLFTKLSSYSNLIKLKLNMGSSQLYSIELIIAGCLLSLTKLEILEVTGNSGIDNIIQQMNRVSSMKLETLNIHTLNIKRSNTSMSSLQFLQSLKKLHTLSLSSWYKQDYFDLITLIQLTQLNEIKLKLKIMQCDIGALINSIGNLVNLKSLVLTLDCEKSEKQNIDIGLFVFRNLIYLEVLSITIYNHDFEPVNWRQIIGSIRYLNKLTELNLSIFNQRVTDEELIEISQSLQFNTNLCKIILEFSKKNSFGDEGLFQLAVNIRSLTKLKYIYLVLLSDQISRTATLMLQQSISSLPTKRFVHLDISDHETALLQFMKLTDPVLPRLQKKNMFHYLCSNKYRIKYDQTSPFLQYNVKSEKTEEEKKQNILLFATSSQTNLGVIGIQGIFNGLSQISNLTTLYLMFRYNEIEGRGINLIGEKISQLTQLKELSLHLEEIKIGQEGTYFIYQSLSKLIQLEYLSLFLNEYYQMSEESNIFKFMLNLKQLRLRNQKNVEVLFETLGKVKSLNCLKLVQHHSFHENYSFYLNQMMKLETIKYLSLYIDLNIGKNENDQLTLFFNVMRKLENLSDLQFSFNTQSYPRSQKQIFVKKLLKFKRLVNYQMKGYNYTY